MRYFLIIIWVFVACKTETEKTTETAINSNETVKETTGAEATKVQCVLGELSKTVDYKNELKKFTEINQDTLIEIENKKIGEVNYRTILDIGEVEQKLWLLIEKENITDSILIHYEDYVEFLFEVQSTFDLEKCEIRQVETFFDEEPEKTEVKTIPL